MIYKRIKCIIVYKKKHMLCAIATILTTILKIFQTLSSPRELSLMKNIGLDSISSYHSVGSWLDYRVCVCVCMCEMMSVCVVCVCHCVRCDVASKTGWRPAAKDKRDRWSDSQRASVAIWFRKPPEQRSPEHTHTLPHKHYTL